MQAQARLITLQAITFLHPGTGQSTGAVDLPIQREVHTGYPMFADSGFKGSLRDKAEQLWGKDHADIETLFGSAVGGEANPSAGSISPTSARILAFPVRSLQQVFVWVTCPMVIKRLLRDIDLIGLNLTGFTLEQVPDKDTVWVSDDKILNGMLILEEVNFTVIQNDCVKQLATLISSLLDEKSGFEANRLVIVPDTDFQRLVRHATQKSARIKLNDRKTTDGDGGNLWIEETLPPETLMYTLALCHDPRNSNADIKTAADVADKLHTLLADRFLQIGGNETVGQGWCCVKVNPAKREGEKP